MKKYNLSYVLVGLAVMVLVVGFAATREQQALADKLVRLHVVANSNTDGDQWMKLQVRDAVLEVTTPLLTQCENPVEELAAHLEDLKQVANETLTQLGSSDSANVTLEAELFPTRTYDSFALPAGTYTSLRVTIGAGDGENWWCVVYPSLCLSASMAELETAADVAGFSTGEVALITEQTPQYRLEFKSLEMLNRLKSVTKWFG